MQFYKTIMTTALLAAGSLTALSASAADLTGNFKVKINVTSTCSTLAAASPANDIDFGTVVAGATPAPAIASSAAAISVTCSKSTPYIVNLTPNSNSTNGTGVMAGPGTDTIPYALYKDAAATNAWGNQGTLATAGNGVAGTGTGLTTPVLHTVYAKVTGSTDVRSGAYSDTVAVKVTY